MEETRKSRPPTITGINLETAENGDKKNHNTSQYKHLMDTDHLVVRRGQAFKLTVTFDQPFNASRHDLRFILQTGDDPRPGNDSYVWFSLSDTPGSKHWDAYIEYQRDLQVTLTLISPPRCIVSQWTMEVFSLNLGEVFSRGQGYQKTTSLFILFNPWCEDDDVYFKEPAKLKEYVLNEHGIKIFYPSGSKNVIYKPWMYGQFQNGVLEMVLTFIKQGLKGHSPLDMADPVLVSRALCKMVNAEDEGGLIEGRWFKEFPEGTTLPWKWTSSVDVLAKYQKNGKPVQYGQCYVFAEVLTTLLRAVGIPCRSISTISATRDIDANLVVDVYDDKPNHAPGEFTWNFHVWNDAWMKRPDLSGVYSNSDWQALDATPTAPSDGHYCLGPAPLRAIRDGKLGMTYDTKFFFCWLNSTECHWKQLGNAEWAIVDVRRNKPIVLTKTPDGIRVSSRGYVPKKLFEKDTAVDVIENITDIYKQTKASRIEGLNFPKAIERYRLKPIAKDIDIKFKKKRHISRGDEFEISVTVWNRSEESRTLVVDLRCFAIHFLYGWPWSADKQDVLVKQREITEDIDAGSSKSFRLKIQPADYIAKLTSRQALRQMAQLYVRETHQYFYKDKDLRARVDQD